jgi:hypothetical protein
MLPVVSAPASAGFGWCRSDPVVLIDGHIADIFVTGPLTAPLQVTGPNEIVITTPPDVDSYLVLSTLGFGRGEIVRFETSPSLKRTASGVEVKVAVYVPATDSSMPVGVEFAPDVVGVLWPERVEGTANSWVVLRTVI